MKSSVERLDASTSKKPHKCFNEIQKSYSRTKRERFRTMMYKFERCKVCRNPEHLLTVIERANRHLKILYKKHPDTKAYVHHLAHHLFDCLMLFGFDTTETCKELVRLYKGTF